MFLHNFLWTSVKNSTVHLGQANNSNNNTNFFHSIQWKGEIPEVIPGFIDLETILMKEENQSTQRKTLGVRLRSTETQPTYDLEARGEPGSQRWEARLITTKPPWLPVPVLKLPSCCFLWRVYLEGKRGDGPVKEGWGRIEAMAKIYNKNNFEKLMNALLLDWVKLCFISVNRQGFWKDCWRFHEIQ